MTPLIMISALVTSYMCYVEGQSLCNGKCVPYDECPKFYEIIRKPSRSPQETEEVRKAHCGYQGNKPKVCCQPEVDNTCVNPDGQVGKCVGLYSCPHIASMLQLKPVPQDTITFVQNSRCEGPEQYNVCCGPAQRPPPPMPGTCIPSFAPPDPASECCGRDGTQSNRIIGGKATFVDQYPWLALIEYKGRDNRIKLLCGAALISGKYVLTAGHCVVGSVLSIATPVNVRLGEYDTSNEGQDCVPTEGNGRDCTDGLVIIKIDKIIPHPQYVPDKKIHDIALIRLTQLAPYTDFIRPVCLPTFDATLSPPENFTFYVAGWGAVSEKSASSKVKLHVNLPYQSLEQCQPLYNIYRRSVQLWKGQICAGGEVGKDSCKGDSGGPLMYEHKMTSGSFFEIIGIVSFGPSPCGKDAVPGVYTKTFEYNSWIRSNIQP